MDNTNADEENLSRIYNNRQKTKKSDQFGLTHAYHQHHEEPRYHLKSSLELKMEEMSGDWTLQTLTEKKKKNWSPEQHYEINCFIELYPATSSIIYHLNTRLIARLFKDFVTPMRRYSKPYYSKLNSIHIDRGKPWRQQLKWMNANWTWTFSRKSGLYLRTWRWHVLDLKQPAISREIKTKWDLTAITTIEGRSRTMMRTLRD